MPKLTLSFTVNEVNLILAGLGELPARMSIDLINSIKAAAEKQVNETDIKVKQVSEVPDTDK